MSRGIYGIGPSINDYANQQIGFMSDQERNRLQREQIAAQINALKQKTAAIQQGDYNPNETAFERDWRLYNSASPEVQQQMERFKRGDPLISKGLMIDPATGNAMPVGNYNQIMLDRLDREKQMGVLSTDVAQTKLKIPTFQSQAESMANIVERMINHPGFSSVVGARNIMGGAVPFSDSTFRSSDARGFQELFKQFEGMNAEKAYETLKGAGAITEVELEIISAAQNAVKTSLSEKEFIQNSAIFLQELRKLEQKALERIANISRQQGDLISPQENSASNQDNQMPNQNNLLSKGYRKNGYYFLGGDETDPNNWRKMNR